MNKERLHELITLLISHSQCSLYLLDEIDIKGMNPQMQTIFKDSKDIFKAFSNHLIKKIGIIYDELYKVDPNTIDTLIEALQYKIKNEISINIEDFVTITA